MYVRSGQKYATIQSTKKTIASGDIAHSIFLIIAHSILLIFRSYSLRCRSISSGSSFILRTRDLDQRSGFRGGRRCLRDAPLGASSWKLLEAAPPPHRRPHFLTSGLCDPAPSR